MRRPHDSSVVTFLARVEVVWSALAVLALCLAFVVVQLSRSGHSTCTQVQSIKAQIEVTLHRSLSSLPSITYYQSHPVELSRALRQTRESIREFQPANCD